MLDRECFSDRTRIHPRIIRRWCVSHLHEVRKISFPERNYYYSLGRLAPFCTNDAVWEKISPELAEQYRADPLFYRGEITMATTELDAPEPHEVEPQEDGQQDARPAQEGNHE